MADNMDAEVALFSVLNGKITLENFGVKSKSDFDEFYYPRYNKLKAKLGMLGIKLELYIGIKDYFTVRKIIDGKYYYGLISFTNSKITIPIEYNTIIGTGPDLLGYIEASKNGEKFIFDKYCRLIGKGYTKVNRVESAKDFNIYNINTYESMNELLLIDYSGVFYRKIQLGNHFIKSIGFTYSEDYRKIIYYGIDITGRKSSFEIPLADFGHIELTKDEKALIKRYPFMSNSIFMRYPNILNY